MAATRTGFSSSGVMLHCRSSNHKRRRSVLAGHAASSVQSLLSPLLLLLPTHGAEHAFGVCSKKWMYCIMPESLLTICHQMLLTIFYLDSADIKEVKCFPTAPHHSNVGVTRKRWLPPVPVLIALALCYTVCLVFRSVDEHLTLARML